MFTGLFFRDEIAAYYRASGLPMPYEQTARRKVMPETLEQRVLEAFRPLGGGPLFRKTSCAVSYAHSLPDYNGHVGIRGGQQARTASNRRGTSGRRTPSHGPTASGRQAISERQAGGWGSRRRGDPGWCAGGCAAGVRARRRG